MHELAAWLRRPDPVTFPYDAVLDRVHSVGKHFVPPNLLASLDRARATLGTPVDSAGQRLATFLSTALDKWDNRFDNPSYLAFEQLPLPGTGYRAGCPNQAALQHDRLFVLLVADLLRFEIEVADGATWLPEIAPDARITAKRCRLGVRAMRPALARMGVEVEPTSGDPIEVARQVCAAIASDTTPSERLTLDLSALPVSLVHDEYMFMRVLQAYESTFAMVAVQLSAAISAIQRGRAGAAALVLAEAERAMGEAGLLFSIVATMRTEAFLTFREFTDGASAIQSRHYKLMESLCRRPDAPRLDSPAYHSVPPVRARVLADQPTVSSALAAARTAGVLDPELDALLTASMERFEAVLLRWRKTHYRLAVRMLGERRGTGYTEGVPYLDGGRGISVFGAGCPMAGKLDSAA
ncbi:tryptophan 2,3-dioxygenase [Antrihabitans sp. YC2-6]|uniref:tryptophan 2,3-dioxygenase n=1 Tax=Antrihabitans sp. YC2-6 TaxID=2799498 RepID=UPI0018F6BA3B|nr:tryptophan 2,3-dioxygenase [Antrihabitans sp. YC2-6]MBJ8346521.1 tryptophan 2,3-dioxygenase [Antrihabitans sp. YC2-6]